MESRIVAMETQGVVNLVPGVVVLSLRLCFERFGFMNALTGERVNHSRSVCLNEILKSII